MGAGRTGLDGIGEELERQRSFVERRSPPYARALELLPEVLAGAPGGFVSAAWGSRRFHAWYDRPLLLLAALRRDARAEGPGHPLFEAFAADPPSAEAVSAERLSAVLDGRRERVFDDLAHRAVQTNETSRAVAWLWPAALAGASGGGRPVALADVGASAGLNLIADALPSPWTAEDGLPLEVARDVRAVARVGLDPAPLDAGDDGDAEWLRACVWPGEREREVRLEQAIAAFRAARLRPDGPVLVPIVARNVPARLDVLSAADHGALVIAYQTLVRDYLDPEEREEYEAGMRSWVAAQPPGYALWTALEIVAAAPGHPPAALVAHVRAPSGETVELEIARCGFHPVRVERRMAEVERLRELLAAGPAAHPIPQPQLP